MAAIKALEQWCRVQCEGYRDVDIINMTTSFRSGLAFCAIIHKHRPDLINYDSLLVKDVFENNRLAFQVAEEKLGIPALLDAEDMVALRVPDRLSILTYVSQYYNYFKVHPSMGGVKRPADGSKEEMSEKKNLPVVAQTFVSKTSIGTRLPPRPPPPVTAQPRVERAPAQRAVLPENAVKNRTLNSKCVACKSHVHLVQRHFVEGKLYHRSCFVCNECSGALHAGSYKPGKEPDHFICKAHQNGVEKPSSEASVKSGTGPASGGPNTGSQTRPAPRPSSVLSAQPNNVVKPADHRPPFQPWTPAAKRTQVARQRFFQAGLSVKDASIGDRKFTAPKDDSKVLAEDKNRMRPAIRKKLAEENCNNNNKRPFSIQSAERRFGYDSSSIHNPGPRRDESKEGSAEESPAGEPCTVQTDDKESPCLDAIAKDDTKTSTVYITCKGPVCEWQTEPVAEKTDLAMRDAEASTEPHESGFAVNGISSGTTRPPSAQTPAQPTVAFASFDPAHFRGASPQKPQHGAGNPAFKPKNRSPVKSHPRRPAVESISSPATAPAIHENPSGAKKGKYLSPTNASRTEMRSPSARPRHIPAEQIERELSDIETNLAQLEREGVELEKKLRSCEEEGEGDILMDPLMVDWFNLIRRKQMYVRKESELVYIARTQELEQQQPAVEGELRRLLEKPDHLKSTEEQQQEKKLLQRLMEIVDGRNAIVEGLDEDRRREVEEDHHLNEMMKNLGVKKGKNKRKSSISKLFGRRSKRRVK